MGENQNQKRHISIYSNPFVFYLQIILGNVNVSILNRNDKVRYKDDYEKFKLILNGIALVLSVINLLFNSRLDPALLTHS